MLFDLIGGRVKHKTNSFQSAIIVAQAYIWPLGWPGLQVEGPINISLINSSHAVKVMPRTTDKRESLLIFSLGL